MAITYSSTAIDYRLGGVVSAIDSGAGNGVLRLYSSGALLSTMTLSKPCGVVGGGVLTFFVPDLDPAASGTGNANEGRMENSVGTVMISGLSVGIPLSGANIIISNGLNSTLINAGQSVAMVSGQIIGS